MVIFIMMTAVPVANAQDKSIDVNEIINSLKPREGTELIYDIMLYLIFFLCFINMGFISDKQLFVSLLNFGVMGLAVVSKLLVGSEKEDILSPTDFPTLVLNVGLMIVPLAIAGMVRKDKGQKTNKAVLPAIIAGVTGAMYFALFWYMDMSGFV